jgi:hypothetical protein
MTEVELLSVDGAHAIVLWRNLVIQIYEEPMEPERFLHVVKIVHTAFRRLHAAPARPVLGLIIVMPSANLPDAATRSVMSLFPSLFDFCATVVDGSDIRASVIRSVISGLGMLARAGTKKSVVERSLASAASELAMRSGSRFVADELGALIGEIRPRIAARRRAAMARVVAG